MASMRDIKRRIKSVGSTKQITKAMNLVAASKLQKAKLRLNEIKPYYLQTEKVISSVVKNSKGIKHPYLTNRDKKNKKIALIILTADRGLCGGYNLNICKKCFSFISDNDDVSLFVVGNKGFDYFNRRKKNILNKTLGISENPHYEDAANIGQMVLDLYKNEEVDEVYIGYTEFESTISHIPTIKKLLPVDTSSFEENQQETKTNKSLQLMKYEPNEEEVLDYLVPKYINTIIFGSLVESATCELGARMTSMDSATENADEMIGKLELVYNRARQSAITQEITEIVSGAKALK